MGHYDRDYADDYARRLGFEREAEMDKLRKVNESDKLTEEEKIILRAVLKAKRLGVI